MRDAFEQACYQHYLEQHKAGKHGSDTPMALKSLMWRQENGQYGVLAFNSAWFGWEAAMRAVALPLDRDAVLFAAEQSRLAYSSNGKMHNSFIDDADISDELFAFAKAVRPASVDHELRAAISELRTALGNPVISGEGVQTVASQTVRAAIARLATTKPEPPKCAGCGTTENLHRDLGSGGPYRCDSDDCIVW